MIWYTPWNQYVSSNWKCDFSFSLSSELVKLEYSFSISLIMVFNIVNAFSILIWELRSFVLLADLLVLVELLDLLDLDLLS